MVLGFPTVWGTEPEGAEAEVGNHVIPGREGPPVQGWEHPIRRNVPLAHSISPSKVFKSHTHTKKALFNGHPLTQRKMAAYKPEKKALTIH